jgi:hypothetical protein
LVSTGHAAGSDDDREERAEVAYRAALDVLRAAAGAGAALHAVLRVAVYSEWPAWGTRAILAHPRRPVDEVERAALLAGLRALARWWRMTDGEGAAGEV